jgi:hypothetical protein
MKENDRSRLQVKNQCLRNVAKGRKTENRINYNIVEEL